MTLEEASKLTSYFHFRNPKKYPHKPLEDKVKLDKAIDYLDTLQNDIPKGIFYCIFIVSKKIFLTRHMLSGSSITE